MNAFIDCVVAACDDIGTPVAQTVKGLCLTGEWTELAKLRVESRNYRDSESYWQDNFIVDLLRKCDLPATVDREKLARKTFWECETQCAATNARLTNFLPESEFLPDPQDVRVSEFITRWRKNIAFVLGRLPQDLCPRFSQGSTYADVGGLITIPDKMSSLPTIYDRSRIVLPLWDATAWGRNVLKRYGREPEVVRGNIFFTVPKDAQAFRGCCKEASVPVSYQLDVGKTLVRRLLRINIDLPRTPHKHRQRSKDASVSGVDATIDMSNASDTICRVLPKLVLDRDWWELLDSLRAPMTRVDGTWVRLEKFSSMGNGFTFELETLLFATLARTVIELAGGDPDSVSCYGDDLIVPSPYYKDVTAALRYFGFTPNMKKTFWEGPFRESCGGDFFLGVPVRAHYVKKFPDEPQEWIAIANGVRRSAFSPEGKWFQQGRWSKVRRLWFKLLDNIPKQIRNCRGPVHLGDEVIHDDPTRWLTKPSKDGWDCVFVRTYSPVPTVLSWKYWTPDVQLASCTLGLSSAGITPRGGVSGYRLAWTAYMPGLALGR